MPPPTTTSAVDLRTAPGPAPADLIPALPPPENHLHFPALDGLRGFAVLLVFLQHYFLAQKNPLLQWGWTGVDFFFVLSGFLITGILYDTRNAPRRLRVFYARRTLRIFPLYFAVLAATLLLTPIFHWAWSRTWLLWPLYLGNYIRFLHVHEYFASNGATDNLLSLRFGLPAYFGHFWSLCVEEQFYLVWPLVVFTVRDLRRLRAICIAVIVAVPLLRLACALLLPHPYIAAEILYRATPFRLDALLIGALVALTLRTPHAHRLRSLAAPALAALAFTFLVSAAIAARIFHVRVSSTASAFTGTLGFTLIDLIAAAILLLSLQPGTHLFRAFSLRPLRRLGQISYGFYVFHDLPHTFYDYIGRAVIGRYTSHVGIVIMPLAFVCTLLLAHLSFRFVEAPFLRLKQRFTV